MKKEDKGQIHDGDQSGRGEKLAQRVELAHDRGHGPGFLPPTVELHRQDLIEDQPRHARIGPLAQPCRQIARAAS